MDHKPDNNAEVGLIRHQLVSSSAEALMSPVPDLNGNLVLTVNIETPNTLTKLNRGNSFEVKIQLGITGQLHESEVVAFNVSCKMVGIFSIMECGKQGISSKDFTTIWTTCASQLFPLVAQFSSDLIAKMGFRNINVLPSYLPNPFYHQAMHGEKPDKKSSDMPASTTRSKVKKAPLK